MRSRAVENAVGMENAPRFPPRLGQPCGLTTFTTAPAGLLRRKKERRRHAARRREEQNSGPQKSSAPLPGNAQRDPAVTAIGRATPPSCFLFLDSVNPQGCVALIEEGDQVVFGIAPYEKYHLCNGTFLAGDSSRRRAIPSPTWDKETGPGESPKSVHSGAISPSPERLQGVSPAENEFVGGGGWSAFPSQKLITADSQKFRPGSFWPEPWTR